MGQNEGCVGISGAIVFGGFMMGLVIRSVDFGYGRDIQVDAIDRVYLNVVIFL